MMIRIKASLQWAALSLICSFPVFLIIDFHGALTGEVAFILSIVAGSSILSANLLLPLILNSNENNTSAGIAGAGIVLLSYAIFGLAYSTLGSIYYPGKFSLEWSSILLGWVIWSLSPLMVTGLYSLPAAYWLAKRQRAGLRNTS